MITIVKDQDKEEFNRLASHPLQSWEWGEFRQKTGIEVVRLGKYENGKLVESIQLTVHQLPFTSYSIGYIPKSAFPSQEMLDKLKEIGKQYKCIFIKLEPNVLLSNSQPITHIQQLTPSSHPLFTKYTFQLDISKNEEELLKNMHPKTRYNIKVAQKNGVAVSEGINSEAFDNYLKLLIETTKRQKFYAHDKKYHQMMWETLKNKNAKTPASPAGRKSQNGNKLRAHLLLAKYQPPSENKPLILTAWIVFLLNGVLYYPYGASSDKYRNVMASNLMTWEAIRFGKKHGARLFDMWGALGPNPNPKDPWYGFHRFKQGYGAKLVEFAGSFDMVINPNLYTLYNAAYTLRQFYLNVKSRFH